MTEYDKAHLPDPRWIPDSELAERIAARITELQAKKRLTKAERQELEQLTYTGPAPRVLPRTEEWPF